MPCLGVSVVAGEEDVGRPVVTAFFDSDGRMTGFKLIIIKQAGIIYEKYPVSGVAAAKVFYLSGGMLPLLNALERELT